MNRNMYPKMQQSEFAPADETFSSKSTMNLFSTEWTVQDVSNLWLRSLESQIKPSTYAKYQSLLQNHILPVYGRQSIDSLTYQSLNHFADQLLQHGGKQRQGLSPKTVSDILSVIRTILCYTDRFLTPVGYLGAGIFVKQRPRHTRVLTLEEQKILQNYLLQERDLKSLGILISLYTGIRIGELCALRWDSISLENQLISVTSTMQRLPKKESETSGDKTEIILVSPKSVSSIRSIPIPDSLCILLAEYADSATGYLLSCSAKHYVEPRSMQNHLKKVLRECCLSDITFHTLRHTFATRCIEQGVEVKSLSEILGHASVSITLNRYVHPTLALKQAQINRISTLLPVQSSVQVLQ